MSQNTQSTPREASTLVMLALHPERHTLMVAMLQRAHSSRVMPGALVFPGGGVEELDGHDADYTAREIAHVQGAARDYEAWGFAHKDRALSSLRAALRETEEEAGVSRAALLRDGCALRCIGRWLTPEALKRRFDTYFWMITLDASQGLPALIADGVEIERAFWIEPKRALSDYERGEVELPAPTLCVLSELAELSAHLKTLDELTKLTDQLAGYAHRSPICPVLHKAEDHIRLYLPGDPLYLERRGDAPRAGTTSFWSVESHHLERGSQGGVTCWRRVTSAHDQ